MRYKDAAKLHTGDEVTRKEDGVTMTVAWTENYKGRKIVMVHCFEDSYDYNHRELK